MGYCIHCGTRVWFWQQAQDPAGTMRDDVHKICRRVADKTREECYKFSNVVCDEIGAPHLGDVYNALHVPYSMTCQQYVENITNLRKKYGQTGKVWELKNLGLVEETLFDISDNVMIYQIM